MAAGCSRSRVSAGPRPDPNFEPGTVVEVIETVAGIVGQGLASIAKAFPCLPSL